MTDKDFLKKIGGNITRIRKQRGYTINFVAQKCEIEKSNLIPIEKGRINTTCLTLLKIATALEIDAQEFFK